MIKFKNDLGNVFAFETIEQKNKFKPDLVEISEDEAQKLTQTTVEQFAEARKNEIKARLSSIDSATVRPLRAIAAGVAVEFDNKKLSDLEAEGAALIEELKAL